MSRLKIIFISVLLSFTALAASAGFYFKDSFILKNKFSRTTKANNGVTHYDRWRIKDDKYLILNEMGLKPQSCKVLNYEGEILFSLKNGICEFSADGILFFLSTKITAFNSEGEVKWESKPYGTHHSSDYSEHTQELFFVGEKQVSEHLDTDTIIGLSRDGKVKFEWNANEHIKEMEELAGRASKLHSPPDGTRSKNTHINSVQIIPPNLNEPGLPAFKRGNLLVSCYFRSLIFIIDRKTQKIVWHKLFSDDDFRGVHRPEILPNGNVFYFLNRPPLAKDNDFSRTQEYNPRTDQVVWEYYNSRDPLYFSKKWSATHKINNDQFMITVSEPGIVAQLDTEGRILWEWHSTIENNEIVPIYEMMTVDKKIVDAHIDAWGATSNTL